MRNLNHPPTAGMKTLSHIAIGGHDLHRQHLYSGSATMIGADCKPKTAGAT